MADHDVTAREAVLADPLLGEVRRRHPDVDVVLLPPEDDTTVAEPLGVDDLAELVQRDERELGHALDDVAPAVEQPPRWSAGTVPGTLVRRSVRAATGLPQAEAEALVAAVAESLEQHGWRVDRSSSGHSRCRAVAGATLSLDVLHVAATGRVAVNVVAGPYPVAEDLARALRQRQREVAP